MDEPEQASYSFRKVEYGSKAYWLATELREEILRRPLGMVLPKSDLEKEVGDIHIVAEHGSTIVGSLTLTPQDNGIIRTRQVAVAQDFQRKGLGQKLMTFAEHISRQMGYHTMILHARLTAVEFYRKIGYVIASERFEEVSIPHYIMRRTL